MRRLLIEFCKLIDYQLQIYIDQKQAHVQNQTNLNAFDNTKNNIFITVIVLKNIILD